MSLVSWFQDAWRKFRPDSPTGDLVQVANKGKYKTANPFYFAARLRAFNGDPDSAETYLFTESELGKALDRAWKNPEDLPWNDDGTLFSDDE